MKFTYIATALFSTFVVSAPADTDPSQESSIAIAGVSLAPEFHITPISGTNTVEHSDAGQTEDGFLQQKLQASLDEIFEQLAEYTFSMHFSYGGFEKNTADLEAKLSSTKTMIERLNPLNYEQLVQVRFADLVYQEMLAALSLFKAFPETAGQDYAILRNLVQTNVCLFTLRDHNGTPDSSIKDFDSIVRDALNSLHRLMTLYGSSGKVSRALDQVVKIQHKRLQSTIFELKAASTRLSSEGW